MAHFGEVFGEGEVGVIGEVELVGGIGADEL